VLRGRHARTRDIVARATNVAGPSFVFHQITSAAVATAVVHRTLSAAGLTFASHQITNAAMARAARPRVTVAVVQKDTSIH